jgi:hypothetical protein
MSAQLPVYHPPQVNPPAVKLSEADGHLLACLEWERDPTADQRAASLSRDSPRGERDLRRDYGRDLPGASMSEKTGMWPTAPRRRAYAKKFGLERMNDRFLIRKLSARKIDQLDACKDDAARRILLGCTRARGERGGTENRD